MGAWSYEVLTNDSALDLMWDLEDSKNIKSDIEKILHNNDNLNEILLAVEIVDISINGIDVDILGDFYGYEEWFKNIEKTPMPELVDDALRVMKHIKNNDFGWVDKVKKERKQLLNTIEIRLKAGRNDMYYRGSIKKEEEVPFKIQCTNCGSHNVDVKAFDNHDLQIECKECGSYLSVGSYNELTYSE